MSDDRLEIAKTTTPSEPRKYAFASLAAAMCLSEAQACRELGIAGSTAQEYRRQGMSEKVADRLAVKAGLHPFEVWPEMAAAHVADVEARRREKNALYARRYWQRYERVQQESRARSAAYREQYGAALNAARRARYATDPEYRERRREASRRAYEQKRAS